MGFYGIQFLGEILLIYHVPFIFFIEILNILIDLIIIF